MWDNLIIIAGGLATLGIFSFLIKENFIYRLFEHIFIGIASGIGVLFTIKNFLYPKIIRPVLGIDIYKYPDGTVESAYNTFNLLYLIPMAFGLLYYFIYSKKHGWLAKLVIGFSLGISGGLHFKGFFNHVMPQIFSSFKSLIVLDNGAINYLESFNNTIFVITLLSVMYYFFFSFKSKSKISLGISKTGRLLLMVCFGAFFGSTIMARLTLLVERVQFLYNDFFGLIF